MLYVEPPVSAMNRATAVAPSTTTSIRRPMALYRATGFSVIAPSVKVSGFRDQALLRRLVLVQELERQRQDLAGELVGLQVAVLVTEPAQRHHGLCHRAMAAGAADVREVLPHELARVARVAEVADRHHQRVVDDADDDRPLDVFELQVEVGDVRDEIPARRGPDERAEHLLY